MVDTEAARHRLPPPWLGNLLVFGFLFTMVLAWLYFQTRQAERVFLEDTGAHARLLADAVALHAKGAVLAQTVTDTILTAHLGSSARFVDYLDSIEPFYADELSAFAAESGLSVIRVIREFSVTQGPADWHPEPADALSCAWLERLIRLPSMHGVLFGVARKDQIGCVLVGLDSRRIEALQAAIGLPRALAAVRALPGVVRVHLEGEPQARVERRNNSQPSSVSIQQVRGGRIVARARTDIAGAQMVLDMDTGPLLKARRRLWLQFSVFALILAVTGGVGTRLLYRRQQLHERQLRDFERSLAQQREEAGLGRAAAAIAHEIRNPLNSVAMGLQRLQIEADELNDEHRRLVGLVLEAVRRTDGTVGSLLDYARPYQPHCESIDLGDLLRDQLAIYQSRIAATHIALQLALEPATTVEADPDLLRQVLDNLLRNALEAQPDGGMLEISVSGEQDGALLSMLNEGLSVAPGELERILQPWFTTKTEGTGLGLSICRRIALAHGGDLNVDSPDPGRLRVRIFLPNPPKTLNAV